MTEQEVSAIFKKRVKGRMNVLRINQRELARRLNMSEHAVGRYLSGKNVMPLYLSLQIAKALDCTLYELMQEEY